MYHKNTIALLYPVLLYPKRSVRILNNATIITIITIIKEIKKDWALFIYRIQSLLES